MRAFPYAPKNQKVFFIAEIGSNHNNSTYRLRQLIKGAKLAGCDAIKLQYYDPETLWSPEFPERREAARKGQTTFEMIEAASEYCKEMKIGFGCSVFDVDLVTDISLSVDFLKIASYECMWKDLITTCKRTSKPLFLSTGMCDVLEVYHVAKMMWPTPDDCIFHCVSMYPTKIEDCRMDILGLIVQTFKNNSYKNIGYSDHTTKPSVIYSALSLGATIFECHVDLNDGVGAESKHGHCWNLHRLKNVIETCHEMKSLESVDPLMDNFSDRPDRKDLELRVDPTDGMRPMKEFRKKENGND